MASILDPAHKTSAVLLEKTMQSFRFAQALSNEINGMTLYILGLDNDQLGNWLNSQTPQNLRALLTSHGTCGTHLNSILDDVVQQLEDSGQRVNVVRVDTRSFDEKLAEQGRQIEVVDGKFVVSALF